MKKIHYLIPLFLVSVFVSAQTMVFNAQEVKAKDYLESKLVEAYETCCKDMKPNKGGFALQRLGKGAKDGMTHRFIWYWEIGEDLWEGTDVGDKALYGFLKRKITLKNLESHTWVGYLADKKDPTRIINGIIFGI